MDWRVALFLFLLVGASDVGAADRILPSALVCEFQLAHSATFENGEFSAGKTGEKISFTFASLDAEKRTAQEIGNQGAVLVYFQPGDWVLEFVELTMAGNVTTTTVVLPEHFEPLDGQRFGAVHSRHVAIVANNMVVPQYLGTCEPRF